MKTFALVTLAAALALAGCAEKNPPKAASSKPAAKGPGLNKGYSHDPFPSTYRA